MNAGKNMKNEINGSCIIVFDITGSDTTGSDITVPDNHTSDFLTESGFIDMSSDNNHWVSDMGVVDGIPFMNFKIDSVMSFEDVADSLNNDDDNKKRIIVEKTFLEPWCEDEECLSVREDVSKIEDILETRKMEYLYKFPNLFNLLIIIVKLSLMCCESAECGIPFCRKINEISVEDGIKDPSMIICKLFDFYRWKAYDWCND